MRRGRSLVAEHRSGDHWSEWDRRVGARKSGDLPALAALRDRSKRFLLDHGAAARTGLAWEHFATGMTPERAQRASMIELVGTEYDTARRRAPDAHPSISAID